MTTEINAKIAHLEKELSEIKTKLEYSSFRYDHVMQAVLEHLVTQTNELRNLNSASPIATSYAHPMHNAVNSNLCSASYAQVLEFEHSAPSGWGEMASRNQAQIVEFLRSHSIVDVLDYGCGSGNRIKLLLEKDYPGEFTVAEYDPGIPELASPPKPHHGVLCIDVLEHVEPALIDNVLDDLKRVTMGYGFIMIDLMPATRILKNGKNAHLILEDSIWWEQKLSERFSLESVQKTADRLTVTVSV
jgi:2-polyprenyl-3-methyl-5-hydroxy-6-metoxy-1,4-benzoquinol methylase